MKKCKIERAISILLSVSMLLSTVSTAFAAENTENFTNSPQDTYWEELVDGDVFVQQTDRKLVAIITSDAEHIVTISIKYVSQPNLVYQWIINDYPVAEFRPDDLSFWNDIIEYAEGKMGAASLVEFSIEEISENDPMVFSSAGADLAADLEGITGKEYADKYTYQLKRMDGHDYRLYETMEFNIRQLSTLSWKSGTSIASVLVSIIGVVATGANVALLCSILGIASSVASTVLPAGKVNKYECMVQYIRYVTVDYGSRQYGHAYKIRNFEGYENADTNSTERAYVIPDTELLYYSGSQTEEYFNSGIFDEAYNAYNNIFLRDGI